MSYYDQFVNGDNTLEQEWAKNNTGFTTVAENQASSAIFSNYNLVLAQYNKIKETEGVAKADRWAKATLGMSMAAYAAVASEGLQNMQKARMDQLTKAQTKNLQQIQARESTIANREAAAKQAQTQARTQGMSKGLASSIGNAPLSGQQSANYGNNLSALKNLGQTTQNDYLQKMGYANALEQQAKNLESGSKLNVIGAAVGGGATGASIGASLFGGIGGGD